MNFLPGTDGFNLVGVDTPADLAHVPAGDKAFAWVGLCNGADSTFTSSLAGYEGKSGIYGFYLMDEPDPTGQYAPICPIANLKAESDWIHTNIPGAKTFIIMMNLGSDQNPSYANEYSPANSDIDLYGLDPYPCRTELSSCEYSDIAKSVTAAEANTIPLADIVPVYQAFGGGTWSDGGGGVWQLPTTAEEQQILADWGAVVPNPPMDYAYSWGQQQSDTSLSMSPTLQAVFKAFNTGSVSSPTPTPTPSPTPIGSGPCGTLTGAHPAQYAHVIWIWMENHPYNEIIGSSQAPYINSLGSKCALSQQAAYDSPFAPSAPNYIAATSGRDESSSNSPGANDCDPASCPDGDVSIFEQVTSWKTYSEGEPTNCDPGFDGNAYDVNHNPAVYYTRIHAACLNNAVPLGTLSSGALVSDLNNNTLPQFSLIDPNLNDDMHNGTIAQGDTYLSQLIPLITSSAAYRTGNTAIFLTWDENEGGVGIPFIAINPYITPGLKFSGNFTHFSLLRTTEEMLGISPYLQNASSAPSMRSTLNL